MDNASFATQAVANGPMTSAPPSFQGHGWLMVINLAVMTVGTLMALASLLYLVQMAWRDRRTLPRSLAAARSGAWVTPTRTWRMIGELFSFGIMLRCGVEALNLWGWDPLRPAETAGFLFAKRLVDPVAMTSGLTGLALLIATAPGILEQLRRVPFPERIWQTDEFLGRMVKLTVATFVAAALVVSWR